MLKAIQEQQTIIEDLKSRIETLEDNMALTKISRGLLNTGSDGSDATAITIDSSEEQVGIGTTSPDSLLHVDGSKDGTLVTLHPNWWCK